MQTTLQALKNQFTLLWERPQRDDLYQIGVPREQALAALTWLKEHSPFVQLTHMSVVDWIEEDEFQITYLLMDPRTYDLLMVCTRIARSGATMESAHKLWPQAVTYEQEMNEMFGVEFPGSPRQGESFILEGWEDIPPMRRDFDTVQFVLDHIPERPGRETINTREFIGRKVGEKRLLHD
jgi:NADH-quinone oxidoreductase subunit C